MTNAMIAFGLLRLTQFLETIRQREKQNNRNIHMYT
jgi:hypothetical protein